jgi:IclR family transcriptional regulator, KDG regulon repressor
MNDISSIKRAIQILDLYINSNTGMGPTEIAERLNLNKATTIRIMSTLVNCGILNKENGRKYILSSKVMDYALSFFLSANLVEVSKPLLQKLKEKTNEELAIWAKDEKGDQRVCIYTMESGAHIRAASYVGETAPLHVGAPGTVILAGLPDNEIEKYLEQHNLAIFTERTITDKKKLKQVIKKIKEQGCWFSIGEASDYAFAASAPIKNHTGEVIASVSINGPIMRLNPEKKTEYLGLVKHTAEEISRYLGYWGKKT